MTHSPDFGAESRRWSAPKVGADRISSPVGADRRRKSTEEYANEPAPVGSDRRQIGMTHSPEIGADFRRRLSAPKSGLCVIGLTYVTPTVQPCYQGTLGQIHRLRRSVFFSFGK